MAERRREVARRHDADDLAVDEDRAVGAGRAAAVDGEADEVAVDAAGLFGGECGAATEVGLAPRRRPSRDRPATA